MDSINSFEHVLYLPAEMMFQSHMDSINRQEVRDWSVRQKSFQSHMDSINSLFQTPNLSTRN